MPNIPNPIICKSSYLRSVSHFPDKWQGIISYLSVTSNMESKFLVLDSFAIMPKPKRWVVILPVNEPKIQPARQIEK